MTQAPHIAHDDLIKEVLLQFLEGENEGVELRIHPPRTLTIGRSEECDVYLGEKKISRRHCQIIVEETRVVLRDLGSTNGTFINEQRLEGEQTLSPTDRVQMGTTLLGFSFQGETGESLARMSDVATGAHVDPSQKTAPRHDSKAPETKGPMGDETAIDQQSLPANSQAALAEPELPPSRPVISDPAETLSPRGSTATSSLKEDAHSSVELELDPDIRIEQALDDSPPNDLPAFETSQDGVSNIAHYEQSEPSGKIDIEAMSHIGLDEKGELSDMEVAPEEDAAALEEDKETAPPKPIKRGDIILKGDLSAMGLADLLQSLAQNKKSGLLVLRHKAEEGEILMIQGELYRAIQEQSRNEKALYRMLGWNMGEFSLHALPKKITPDNTAREFELPLNNLLMNGFRQYDELQAYQSKLPEPTAKLILQAPLEAPLSKLHPRVLDVLQLVINTGKVQSVLDQSTLTDLETTKVLLYLIRKQYVAEKTSKKSK